MKLLLRSWLVGGALLASACIIRPNPNDPTNQNNQTQTQTQTAGQGQGQGHIATTNSGPPAIIIANRSSTSICFVNISSSSDNDWGGDRLGSSEVIGAGASRSWTVDPGSWDVRLQDCQHNNLAERRGIAVRGPTQVSYP
ncbi:MAG: hypothetical protein HYY06_27895 [Deltaproteobacteria bacterium]|nr:hypothetical protein [Deltaproteobacteria bacterium]